MFRTHGLAVVVVATIFAACWVSNPAQGCSCEGNRWLPADPALVEKVLDNYKWVFLGQVTEIVARDPYGDPHADGSIDFENLEVTLRALRVWKGRVTATMVVRTSADEGLCRYPFKAGSVYLVFAGERKGSRLPDVDLCSLTEAVPEATRSLSILDSLLHGHAPHGRAKP